MRILWQWNTNNSYNLSIKSWKSIMQMAPLSLTSSALRHYKNMRPQNLLSPLSWHIISFANHRQSMDWSVPYTKRNKYFKCERDEAISQSSLLAAKSPCLRLEKWILIGYCLFLYIYGLFIYLKSSKLALRLTKIAFHN